MILGQKFSGPNATALRTWLETHMPELDEELGPMVALEILAKLNAITGASVSSSESIEAGCAVFLNALQTKHTEEAQP